MHNFITGKKKKGTGCVRKTSLTTKLNQGAWNFPIYPYVNRSRKVFFHVFIYKCLWSPFSVQIFTFSFNLVWVSVLSWSCEFDLRVVNLQEVSSCHVSTPHNTRQDIQFWVLYQRKHVKKKWLPVVRELGSSLEGNKLVKIILKFQVSRIVCNIQ